MMSKIFSVDWLFLSLPLLLSVFSLTTLFHFAGDNTLFYKSLFISLFGLFLFFLCLQINFSFLKNSHFTFWFYIFSVVILSVLLLLGTVTNNAQSWFKIFGISYWAKP
jgi:cell division protein FtsW (lipid II flippase)